MEIQNKIFSNKRCLVAFPVCLQAVTRTVRFNRTVNLAVATNAAKWL